MYCYKDDKCDTFKELTSSGGLSDPGDKRMFGNYSSLDPNCIIHQPQCIYKLKEMESIDRARSLTNKALETRDSCESLANQRNVVEHDSHEERI